MDTSQEDTSPTDGTGTAPQEPTGSVPASEDTGTLRETEASGAFLAGTPTHPSGGLFSAETFSIIALMLFVVTATNTRLLQLFSLFAVGRGSQENFAGNTGVFSTEIAVAGGSSALAVLAGALSLFLGGYGTRAWSRWSAAATVIVGTLLVVVSVLAFVSLPAGA